MSISAVNPLVLSTSQSLITIVFGFVTHVMRKRPNMFFFGGGYDTRYLARISYGCHRMIWDRGSSKGNCEDRLYVHSHHCCFVVFSFYFKSNVHAKRVCQKPNEDQTRVQSLNSIHFITNDPFCSKWFALHILTIQALHFGEKKHVHYDQEMKLVYSNSN